MSQEEATAWRQIAERMDASGEKRLYATELENLAALARLKSYDNSSWAYGPDDPLWLALDAEDETQ